MVPICATEEYARLKELGINSVHIDSLFLNVTADGDVTGEIEGKRIQFDAAHENGMMAVLAFGGAYLPKWLYGRYPDCRMMMPDGTAADGGWTPYCLNHPGVRKELKNYFEGVVNGLKDHPALLGWNLWNEPHLYGFLDYNPFTVARFHAWLRRKYRTVAALNSAWYAEYTDFTEATAPADPTGTSLIAWIDWMRFRQEDYAEFFRWQADIIRRLDPDHPILTEVVPFDIVAKTAYSRAVNTRMWARSFCDVVGFDTYSPLDGTINLRWKADFMRDMAEGKPCWDTEAGFAWVDKRGRPSPETESSAFWMQFARGINGRFFFYWSPDQTFFQRFTYPDKTPEPGMYALQRCSNQLARHQDLLAQTRVVQAQVGILHSMATGFNQAAEANAISRANEAAGGGPDRDLTTMDLDLTTVIQCLYRKHIPYQYVTEDEAAAGIPKQFKALIVIGALNVSDELLKSIRAFVDAGGHVFANVRFSEFNENGRKREAYPPKWFGVQARQWHRSPRKKTGTLSLERKAVNHLKQPVDVKVVVNTYESMPMQIVKRSAKTGLPVGDVVGVGTFYGQGVHPTAGRGLQTRESIAVLPGAEVVATFEDGTPAIVATARTMYIARDTCWVGEKFATLVESFMLAAGVRRLAYARDEHGIEIAPLDIVLCQTPKRWVLYATNSPKTLRYDGLPLKDVRVALPSGNNLIELLSGRSLPAVEKDGLLVTKLDFNEGETKILVVDKSKDTP